jgi:hypothetical protein
MDLLSGQIANSAIFLCSCFVCFTALCNRQLVIHNRSSVTDYMRANGTKKGIKWSGSW